MKKSRIIRKILSIAVTTCLLLSCMGNFPASAAGNMAFSVGCNYGSGDIDTSRDALKACDYYALAGYLSRYTCNPNVSKMTASYNGTKLLSSDIVFMAGHGSNDGMHFNSLQQYGSYNLAVSDNSNLYNYINPANYVGGGKVKLMVFAGCETAKGTNNITKRTKDYGALATIGWTILVGDESMYQWSNKFNNCIALGYTIQNAINYANSFNYGDNTCKSYKLYGNGSQVLKRTTSTAAINTLAAEDASVSKVSNAEINISNVTSKSKVEKIIRDCFSDFAFNDFEIDVAISGDDKATLTVVEKIGDFVTQNAYVLFYENGKITKIYDRTVRELSVSSINTYSTTAPTINKQHAFSLAAEKVDDYYTITEQKGKAMLDVETGERYYMVYTTICTEQGAKSVVSYKYSL